MSQHVLANASFFLPMINQSVILDGAKSFLVSEFVKDRGIKGIFCGDKFLQWFSRKVEVDVPRCEYFAHPLRVTAADPVIVETIVQEGRRPILYMTHLAVLWQRQRYGEAGMLATNSQLISCYAKDSADIVRNIVIYRGGSEWRFEAYEACGEQTAGTHVLSHLIQTDKRP